MPPLAKLSEVSNLAPHLIEFFVQGYGNWQTVYIVVIAFLAGLALVLEVITWITYPARKAAKAGKLPAGKSVDEEATELADHPREGEGEGRGGKEGGRQ